ncbi:MAG TPA: CoA transferase, partial [Thermoanaerobaculia bacterium]|nr:CoA transferase [Thermoanaerobaculia bacterium]
MTTTRLDDCRVIEIGGAPSGAYAAKLFAELGAEVVKIEPPEGDPLRQREPADGVENGALFAYLNTSKRSLVLDLDSAAGRRELERLAAAADVVIESASPGPFEPISSSIEAARLVRAWISPFGRSGPYRTWKSVPFTDEALGGHLFLNGDRRREPLQRPGHQASYQAGVQAFIGAAAALYARGRTGRGQTVEVTHLDGLASLHQFTTMMWMHARYKLGRDGNRQTGHYHPVGAYPCKDGWVCLAMPIIDMLLPFLEEAGLDHIANDPRFADDFARGQNKGAFDAAIAPWLAQHTVEEVVAIGLRARAPIGPVLSSLDLLDDPHIAARGFLRDVRVGDRVLRYPRGPFLIEGREPRLAPPPELGEANRRGLDWSPRESDREFEQSFKSESGATATHARLVAGPLDGVRILDLTRVWAGPLATRILGDLGADVLKIEAAWARGSGEVPAAAGPMTHLYPGDVVGDRPWNREISFNKLNRNKRSVTLELDSPRGRELFLRLAETADVVIDNFSPRVMGKLGLDPESLHRLLNPRLVCVSMPGFGSSGPYRDWLAFGPLIEAMSGLTYDMAYADGGPTRSGVAWPDPVTAIHSAAATVAALLDRDADPSGSGATVEVPMLEAMVCFYGEELLGAQGRGVVAPRRGSRHADRAPQGCYQCAGEDRWIAIGVTSDDEWRALCEEAGLDQELARLSFAERQRRHDEIDRALEAFTTRHEADALMRRLQDRGVIAATVADAARVVDDPQLRHDGFWVELKHAEVGPIRQPGLAIRLSETPATFRRAAPCLGQHNAEVLGGELGLSERELAALAEGGVIADRPPPGASFRKNAKKPAAAQA